MNKALKGALKSKTMWINFGLALGGAGAQSIGGSLSEVVKPSILLPIMGLINMILRALTTTALKNK